MCGARTPKNGWSAVCARQVFVCSGNVLDEAPNAGVTYMRLSLAPLMSLGWGVLAVPARAPRGVSCGVVEPFRDAWVPGGYRERGRVDAVLYQPGGHLEMLLDALGFKAAAAAVPAAPKRERRAQTIERTLCMLSVPFVISFVD